jgi:hypothetical protein
MEVEAYKGPQSFYYRQQSFMELLFLVGFWFSRFLFWKNFGTCLKRKCLMMWAASVWGMIDFPLRYASFRKCQFHNRSRSSGNDDDN